MNWDDRRIEPLPKSGLVLLDPWLVIHHKNRPMVRLDLRALDEVRVGPSGTELLLVCRELEVGLHVADGPEATRRLAREASRLTRGSRGLASSILFVGDDPVSLQKPHIQIGTALYRFDEVRNLAHRGANLELANGAVLQAAMALLVVAATE